ncbi:MAG: hypothetical protein F4Y12_06630 [Acidimicrobiaceae bacterium]|nr:hypothetical protein [Acidimicrobiaceae bacterium]MYH76117.1 hypothetical protein [Acidimicrobiaceae bacterium]MYK75898.1 hypothetical protein [Acidimicrobiaceae bacterium]
MSRRLEIELTSQRPDGTWTWRAAGARQPKGDVSGDLVPDTASVGTVLKAEADGGLDGLEIIAVSAPRIRAAPSDRLELIGGSDGPLVTTALAPKSRRRDRDDRRGRDKDRPGGRDRRDGRDGDGRRDRRRDRRGKQTDGGDDGKARKSRRDGDTRTRSRRDDGGRPRDPGSSRDRDRNEKRSGRRDRRPSDRRSEDGRRSERPPRPRTPGLKAKRVHREAALAALSDDQQPLAREVLKAGVPGVRKSIERMNAKAAAESLPQIKSEPILALAEQLAPVLKAAEWHDRADAALAGISKIDLRDIRSVIAAADRAARTDETRALAESLRAGLAQRLEVDHRRWLDELAGTIGEGRTIRALRLSSRPPKAGTPLPVDMAERLANMAAEDLSPNTNQQRWSTVVDSVALSPVRTQVIPLGAPEKPSEDLLATIRRLADRVPQIAALFGIEPQAPSPRGRRPPPPPPAPEVDKATEQPTETPAPEPEATTDTEAADTAEQLTDTEAATDTPETS